MIYEKLPGSPAFDPEDLSAEQLDLFIDTYVAQSIKISNLKFPAIGSLEAEAKHQTEITVGPVLDTRNTNGPNRNDFGGPFRSKREEYLHHVEELLSAIKADTLFRHAPLEAYLAHLEVRDLILASPVLREEDHEFYLQHPDQYSDNILIGPTGAVSALLDWEW